MPEPDSFNRGRKATRQPGSGLQNHVKRGSGIREPGHRVPHGFQIADAAETVVAGGWAILNRPVTGNEPAIPPATVAPMTWCSPTWMAMDGTS